MKVKICGFTCLEDALAAVEAGADLLGFNFYQHSPRFIDPQQAAHIVGTLKDQHAPVQMVGVFVNSTLVEISATLDAVGLDLAQLSGDERPEILAGLGGRAFKALRPRDAAGLHTLVANYPACCTGPAYLVDAYRAGQYGGTGQIADWSLARALTPVFPILLAGGLTPENVAGAVRQVNPWGVDVASGVETAPGRKDAQRMAEFVKKAKEVIL